MWGRVRSMGVFTLTIVRHGETHANYERVIQGQKDTELSEKGIQQAELAAMRLQQETFTHVYSSDLKRAYKTCEIIVEKNTACNCPIITDTRLRERRFGIFEGRPSAEFHLAAKKHRKSGAPPDEFPPGGETAAQLLARARDFFHDLCAQILREVEGNGNVASTKRQTQIGNSEVFQSMEATACMDVTNLSSSENKLSPTVTRDSSHSSSGSTSSTSGCESLTTGSSLEQLLEHGQEVEGTQVPENAKITGFSQPLDGSQLDLNNHNQAVTEPTSDISPSQESSCSSLDESLGEPAVICPTYDADIQSSISAPRTIQYGCPNVSLSPIFEHRLSSMSSISSGHNNSFDDGDSVPVVMAEVLVVSHGGLIQQMITYFIDSLGCKIPGGKKHALQVSPNTGLSKFTVALEPGMERPVIICLSIHDKDHLVGAEVAPLQRGEEA